MGILGEETVLQLKLSIRLWTDWKDWKQYNGHLLADAGYICTKEVLTPLRVISTTILTPAQKRYQKSHIKTRSFIERVLGMFKNKFQVLRFHLRMKMITNSDIIVACTVLWNFLLERGEITIPIEDIQEINQESSDEKSNDEEEEVVILNEWKTEETNKTKKYQIYQNWGQLFIADRVRSSVECTSQFDSIFS